MKRLAKYLLLSVWVLGCLCVVAQGETRAGYHDPLQIMMQTTGTMVREWSINGWTELSQPAAGIDELAQQSIQCLREVAPVHDQPAVVTTVTPRFALARAEYSTDREHVVVVSQQMNSNEQGWKRYLLVRIERADGPDHLQDMTAFVRRQLRQQGGNPVISTCLFGWRDDKLEKEILAKTAKLAIMRTGARPRGIVSEDGFVSASGFVPGWCDPITVQHEPVNVHIAVRVCEQEGRTYVSVGSPFIYDEY